MTRDKTSAQAGFGLHHAAKWGKARVIVAVPFITITEQNAQVYRSMLDGDDGPVVLEHLSSLRFDADYASWSADSAGRQRWARLAAENWDAPFVVTTTVQLFESLFGRRPSQVEGASTGECGCDTGRGPGPADAAGVANSVRIADIV